MKRLICLILLISLVVVNGCSFKKEEKAQEDTNEIVYNYEILDINDAFSFFNNEHKKLIEDASFSDLTKYLIQNPEYDNLLSNDEIKELLDVSLEKNIITSAELKEDIDLMFRTIKSSYSGYYYFNENSFEEACNNLLKYADTKETFTFNEAGSRIFEELDFIIDKHFVAYKANRDREGFQSFVYYTIEQYFSKDENGYYKLDNNDKWYFKNDENNIEIKTFLNEKGELVYGLVSITKDNSPSSITLTNDNGEERKEDISWVFNEPYSNSDLGADFKYVEIDNVSYISYRKGMDKNNFDQYDQFIESAQLCKNSKAIIFDIRSNGGGSDMALVDWIKAYTGLDNVRDNQSMFNAERISKLSNAAGFSKGESSFFSTQTYGKQVSNEIPIYVLTDMNCGSGGEELLCYLKSMENVIVVGSNTGGAQVCGNQIHTTLPNSGIVFNFGMALSFRYNSENIDGYGYCPDVYTDVKQSLNNVLQLLVQNGGLSIESSKEFISKIKTETNSEEKIQSENNNTIEQISIEAYGNLMMPCNIDDAANFGGYGKEEFDVYNNNQLIKDFEVKSLTDGFVAENKNGKLYVDFNNSEKTNYFAVIYCDKEYIFAYEHFK